MQSRLKMPLGRNTAMERIFEIDLSSEESIRDAIMMIRHESRNAQISGAKLVLEIWKDRQTTEGGHDVQSSDLLLVQQVSGSG